MTLQGPELSEKNFINESNKKDPFPFWLWLVLMAIAAALLWGGMGWYTDKVNLLFSENPFLQVTNRQMSLFLWQNPEFMRINAKEKGSYLPAFKYLDKVTIDVGFADEYAAAPPELLFRYHTWNRLLKKEFIERPIPLKDFRDFLSYAEEWQPRFWPDAPKGYRQLVEGLSVSKMEDLSTLSYDELPLDARIAFQGWQNYFKEGEAINNVQISQSELKKFLSSHPHYARNYWQNIVPDYLKSEAEKDEANVPAKELAPFLKVALYNYLKANQSSTAKEIQK
jgi:hypothetical protein